MVLSFKDMEPQINKNVFIAWNATVSGQVILKNKVSIWYNATLRADLDRIEIGSGTNIQDNAVIHVDPDGPAIIGKNVTVGHSAVLHACTVEDGCLIGMGAIILDHTKIGKESVVGAGALVSGNKEFPPRSLIIGSPARAVRQLKDEDIAKVRENTLNYQEMARLTAQNNKAGSWYT